MHITKWEASRSGAGITIAMTDAGGVRHKQFVKKIVSLDGTVTAFGGDGARFPLNAGRETSAEVAAIAGRVLAGPFVDDATCDRLIEAIAAANSPGQARAMIANELSVLRAEVHMLAASALGQRAD